MVSYFLTRSSGCDHHKTKAPREINYGARNQAAAENEAKKIPKTTASSVFGDLISNQTRLSLTSFLYPDYTVGPGVPPDHVLKALVGCTTDREFTCVFNTGVTLPRRFLFGYQNYNLIML